MGTTTSGAEPQRPTGSVLTALFPDGVPMEAMDLLFRAPSDMTLGQMRERIREMAAVPAAARGKAFKDVEAAIQGMRTTATDDSYIAALWDCLCAVGEAQKATYGTVRAVMRGEARACSLMPQRGCAATCRSANRGGAGHCANAVADAREEREVGAALARAVEAAREANTPYQWEGPNIEEIVAAAVVSFVRSSAEIVQATDAGDVMGVAGWLEDVARQVEAARAG